MTDKMSAEELADIQQHVEKWADWDDDRIKLLDHIAALESDLATSEAAREELRDALRDIAADDKRGIPGALARQALLGQKIATPRELPSGEAAALRMVADMTGDEADAEKALDAAMREDGP
jgi:hypothetical protein